MVEMSDNLSNSPNLDELISQLTNFYEECDSYARNRAELVRFYDNICREFDPKIKKANQWIDKSLGAISIGVIALIASRQLNLPEYIQNTLLGGEAIAFISLFYNSLKSTVLKKTKRDYNECLLQGYISLERQRLKNGGN